jgi:DNA-binding helix-turn-helix protein
MLLNKIGKILKQERIKNNLTLETLSNMTNISISTLSNIENISGVFLYRLSKAFNIDYNYLLRLRWDIFPTFLYERKSSIGNK